MTMKWLLYLVFPVTLRTVVVPQQWATLVRGTPKFKNLPWGQWVISVYFMIWPPYVTLALQLKALQDICDNSLIIMPVNKWSVFCFFRALFQIPGKSVDSDTDSRLLYTLWCMHVGCGWEICNRVLKIGAHVCSRHVKVRLLGGGCQNHLTNSFIMNIPTVPWKWRHPVFLIVLPHQIAMSRWFLCSWRVECTSYLSDM